MVSDLSPLSVFGGPGDLDRLGGPNHATSPSTYSTGQPAPTTIPAFSYPTAVSSARAGYTPINVAPYDTSSQIFTDSTTTPAYPTRPTISPSPTYYRTAIEWQRSPASDSLYASEDSSAVSASSVANSFGYATQSGGSDPYMGDYVSPTGSSQEASVPSPNIYWSGDTVMSTVDPSFSDTSNSLANPPYPVYGLPGTTPDRGFSDSEGRAMMTGEQTGSPPGRKRIKKSPEKNASIPSSALSSYGKPLLAPAPPPGSGPSPINTTPTAAGNKSKLRSASRTSKNIVPRPSESAEERKTRNSHNLVEKQYRNRLNAQFESLLNALPDSVKSPGGTSGSGGESDGAVGLGVDLGERRLSKAEVLDMSRRYIQSLESQRDKLEREREDLQGRVARGEEGGGE